MLTRSSSLATLGLALALTSWCHAQPAATAAKRPNVVMIAMDDLNAWPKPFGAHAQVIAPNLERLAARGVTFTRAYAASPVCNASRTALLTGLRPGVTGIYKNTDDWRVRSPQVATLPAFFRDAGYRVAGAGKLFHGSFIRAEDWDAYGPKHGDDPAPAAKDARDTKPRGSNEDDPTLRPIGGLKFGPLDLADAEMNDHKIVSWTIDQLAQPRDRPLFLACGIYKPHMPWNVPRKYFDLYPLDQIQLPPSRPDDLDDVPAIAAAWARTYGESGVKMEQSDHEMILVEGKWREAVQAYLASITFADAQLGRLVDAIDRSPERDNTIVVLWGDHGWHLGEKLHWRKFTLWEEGTRTPFIWVAPGITPAGALCNRPVDLMSVYPTLAALCGLPPPPHVRDPSIQPLLANPRADWLVPAVSTFLHNNHAVRDDRWRYIRYRDGTEELYDEANDPHEWTNLAARPELAGVKLGLARWLPVENHPPSAPRKKRE